MSARPNILLITTDQQRYDAMGCAGNPIIRTPHMDRLAAEGVRFADAASSCPVCVPARVSIISGLMPGKLRLVNNSGLKAARPARTLAGLLGAAGYHTQAIGKMHFMPSTERYGFEDMTLSEEMRWVRQPALHPDGRRRLDDYDRYLHERGLWGWEKPPEIGYNEIKPVRNPLPIEHHVTTWCGDRTVEYLDRDHGRPFFLWSSFTKPHVPYDAPQGMENLYDAGKIPLPLRQEGELPAKHPNLESWRRRLEFHLYSDEAGRIARAWYYANITLIDRQIGRMLEVLERRGLLEDTLILFTSDHGDLMGDHWLWYKSLGYEAALRVPLIARWPGGPRGAASRAHASLVDVMPTLLAAAGCEIPAGLPGLDLAAVQGGKTPDREFACAEIIAMSGMSQYLRTRDWKYIHHENGDAEELYDLCRDPNEFVNLASRPEHDGRRKRFRAQTAQYLQEYSDPQMSLAGGDLRGKPLTPIAPDPGPYPFSRMPWEVRVPPSLLGDLSGKARWWAEPGHKDLTCLLGIEE